MKLTVNLKENSYPIYIENGNFIVCLVPKIDTLTGEVGEIGRAHV